jgi:TetR/AcrR family fatty acid metabolism transcriptional regulator
MNENNDSSKRDAIIHAAQEILSEKGLRESTISEIAQRGGVFDSVIYRYFKNKEDLLFCSLSEKLKEATQDLMFQFSGIIGATAKLGKMIWFHLHSNDFNSSSTCMTKNLLFESRSNKKFYEHEGYQVLRGYTSILASVLKEGVENGSFRNDFTIHLVRDMIFGFIDEEAISCLLCHEIDKTTSDFDSIMSLILAMIQSDSSTASAKDNSDKSARIIEAATKVFAAKGYDKATTMEIATEAQVAEGTVYEYFKNKEELLFSISEQQFMIHKTYMEGMFESEEPVAKLQRSIHYYANLLLSNPKFAVIFLKDTKMNKRFYNTRSFSYLLDCLSILNTILNEGKDKAVFRSDVNNRVFRNLFLGSFSHLIVRWFVVGKVTPIKMMEELSEIATLLCRSVTRRVS